MATLLAFIAACLSTYAQVQDQGAKQLIKQYRDEIAYLDCDDPKYSDIDQPSTQ